MDAVGARDARTFARERPTLTASTVVLFMWEAIPSGKPPLVSPKVEERGGDAQDGRLQLDGGHEDGGEN
jgi:hypothetical protein